MDSAKTVDDDFSQVRREESKAHNELSYYEGVAKGQKTQMAALLQHKDECVKGIARAKKTGLPPVHVREFELLMAHIDLTLETLLYKVDKSKVDYEKAKEIWLQKCKVLADVKEEMKQKDQEKEGEFTDFNEMRKNSEKSGDDAFKHKEIKSA